MDVGTKCGAQEAQRFVRVVQKPDLQGYEAIRPKVDHLHGQKNLGTSLCRCRRNSSKF
jgi:hypothetical protein